MATYSFTIPIHSPTWQQILSQFLFIRLPGNRFVLQFLFILLPSNRFFYNSYSSAYLATDSFTIPIHLPTWQQILLQFLFILLPSNRFFYNSYSSAYLATDSFTIPIHSPIWQQILLQFLFILLTSNRLPWLLCNAFSYLATNLYTSSYLTINSLKGPYSSSSYLARDDRRRCFVTLFHDLSSSSCSWGMLSRGMYRLHPSW
jgi:hypothetical protein